jgi:uncharacterized protein (DUF1697 family)
VTRLVVLLKGINLGSRRRIPMADLRTALEEAGFEEVRTHLQSGNVVLSSGDRPPAVSRAIEAAIRERFGMDVDVVVRTADELAAVVAADPLGDVADDPAKHLVAFLSAKPDRAALRELERQDFGAERLAAGPRELHAWCPGGIQRSGLMAALGRSELAPVVTVRNWRTVTRLLDLAQG